MRTAVEFERAGAAGICIEDNEFPKRCSFYAGVSRDLVPVDEHAAQGRGRRLRAPQPRLRGHRPDRGADRRARHRRGARPRAGLRRRGRRRRPGALEGEGLRRAGAVRRALGPRRPARRRADDVSRRWAPTSCAPPASAWRSSPTRRCARRSWRCATCWPRCAARAARRASRGRSSRSRRSTALVGVPELKANEERFLFAGARPPRAIILAAGFEPQLMPLIQDRPKTMLEVKGKTILERQVEALARQRRPRRRRRPRLQEGAGRRRRASASSTTTATPRPARSTRCSAPSASSTGRSSSSTATSSSSRRSWRSCSRTRADVALVVDRAFHDAFRAGLHARGRPARPGRHRDAAERPALRRARRRQPRAPHRPRGRARPTRTASSSAWRCSRPPAPRRCASVHAELVGGARRGPRARQPHAPPAGDDRSRPRGRRRSTSTRAGWRSTASTTTAAPGRKSAADPGRGP